MPKSKSTLIRSAVLSECSRYRYVLRRSGWDTFAGAKPAVFIMLNPSTADAYREDPTIRRCIGFARSWKRPLAVVNLFAYRARSPQNMLLVDDPIGPGNLDHIVGVVCDHDPGVRNKYGRPLVICAWGSFLAQPKCPRADITMLAALRDWDVEPMCLGRTSQGFPRHPLYAKADSKLVPYLVTPPCKKSSSKAKTLKETSCSGSTSITKPVDLARTQS